MSSLADWFATRRWRVYAEADGDGTIAAANGDDIAVHFKKGRFWVESPGAFTSPLGNAGRNGVILQEVDAAGNDIPGSQAAFGSSVVARAREEYGAVTG